ncbi:MAG: NAD(P)H-binding protein, partial [Verrucomicrobiota bacterium]
MSSPVVAIAGASGFVGSWLLRGLDGSFDLIGLSRSLRAARSESRITWRQADLFSLPKLIAAMEGADTAIYLVHSMLPSSRMVQGNFADLDLLLADNFVRAADQAGVKHIIYLGGLIPEDDATLSDHLSSRKEVEEVLRSRSMEVTVLRSGLVYGRGGSSIRILLQLVRRLPVMVLPRWTRKLTQSTDVRDVVRAIQLCLTDSRFQGGTWDIASHEPMTYRDMIMQSAKVLGIRPHTVDFPANFIGLSKLWVSVISQTSPSLVNPLLASLRHSMKARDNALLLELKKEAVPFEQSVKDSVDENGRPVDLSAPGQRRRRRRR